MCGCFFCFFFFPTPLLPTRPLPSPPLPYCREVRAPAAKRGSLAQEEGGARLRRMGGGEAGRPGPGSSLPPTALLRRSPEPEPGSPREAGPQERLQLWGSPAGSCPVTGRAGLTELPLRQPAVGVPAEAVVGARQPGEACCGQLLVLSGPVRQGGWWGKALPPVQVTSSCRCFPLEDLGIGVPGRKAIL